MAKTKISEWSTTPASNTDIDGINIAEGCAPSGINDAIRDLMAQVRSWQSGASGDPFNGPMNGTIGATTAYSGAFTTLSASGTVSGTGFSTYLASPPAIGGTAAAAGSFTTLSASSTLSVTGAGSIQGLTVGRGAGAVSTNTAVGASALAANSTGANNTGNGMSALVSNTTGSRNSAIGRSALGSNDVGADNSAFGYFALQNNSSGTTNTALGVSALQTNTTGTDSTAVGYQALYTNSTSNNLTAMGSQAGYLMTGASGTFLGYRAGYNVTGTDNTVVGHDAMYATTTGTSNVAVGKQALRFNTSASYSTAVGYQAAYSNTTGGITAFGHQAGYSNQTGLRCVFLGRLSGYSSTGDNNTFVGYAAGNASTGVNNTFVGGYNSAFGGAGGDMTTGSKNTILGTYTGNQGGLDIRTASNYIVLSDGDGNPYAQCNASFWKFGIGGTGSAYGGGSVSLNGSTASGYQPTIGGYGNGTSYWTIGTKGAIDGSASTFLQLQNTGGGVYLNGASATSWTAVSDERLKENLVDITDAATKVASLRAVVGNYTWDAEKSRKPFLIAQDVQAVLPEAVSASRQIKGDETEYLGVSYTEVIPLLVAAIKELKAEIDTLKGNV